MSTNYFTREELKCKCGCNACEMDPEFVKYLNTLREFLKTPMIITSGYRCLKHNKAIGGEERSQHLLGIAVDIAMTDPAKRYELIKIAGTLGFKGIGIEKTFVHIDRRTSAPVMWVY